MSGDNGGQRRLAPRSFLVMSARAPFDPELGNAPLRTLAALSSYRSTETGLAFPSTARLARELGLSQRAVQKNLTILERLGYIAEVVDPRAPSRGSRTFRVDMAPKQSPTKAN